MIPVGNRTAVRLMLYLFHYGEVYGTGMAKDLGIALSPIQRQLDKFEAAGFLISKMVGNTRVYSFNPKQPATNKLKELIQIFYEAMSENERQKMFRTRRRPRRRGKPVIGRDS